MIRWPFRKKGDTGDDAAHAAGQTEDEWAFLREQPDHDADEMSSVRGGTVEESPREPIAAWQPASAPAPRRAPAPAPAEAAASPLSLEITTEGGARRLQVFGEALIGRADSVRGIFPEVDLTGDDGVSRQHALISPRGDGYTVRDLDSIGGTRLNGDWLASDTETPLTPGDCLELGHGSRIRILGENPCGDDHELSEEDLMLSGMLMEAMGVDPPASLPAPEARLEGARKEAGASEPWQPGRPAAYAGEAWSAVAAAPPEPWQPRSAAPVRD